MPAMTRSLKGKSPGLMASGRAEPMSESSKRIPKPEDCMIQIVSDPSASEAIAAASPVIRVSAYTR